MIKKILFCTFLIINFALNGYCFSDNTLRNIEISNYGQSYENQSLSERLNRLETDFFGTEQTGDLDSRINKLSRISSNNIQNPMNLFDNGIYPLEKKGLMRTFLDNVSSAFSQGSYTGFTPPMMYSGYNSYPNNFYSNGFSTFSNSYCPYNNNYYPHNSFYNRNFNPTSFRNIYKKPPRINHYNNYPHHNRYNNAIGNTPRRINSNILTNFNTGSSVHILRD